MRFRNLRLASLRALISKAILKQLSGVIFTATGENYMKLRLLLLSFFTISLILAGCTDKLNEETNKENTSMPETITANIQFRVSVNNSQDVLNNSSPLPGVAILLIGTDGKVIDKLVTNKQGEAQKDIAVFIDHKYLDEHPGAPKPRGTVTAIAFKEGYRQAVLFEVPVSEASAAQPFSMEPIVDGERNEPDVQLGNNHHLEIISLVEKYAAILNSDQ